LTPSRDYKRDYRSLGRATRRTVPTAHVKLTDTWNMEDGWLPRIDPELRSSSQPTPLVRG
jgi:hypothetical protein